jgi:hypothetical protein
VTGRIGTTVATVESFRDGVSTMHTDIETDSTFQGSFYTITVKRPDDLGCSEQPKLTECIRVGQEAWHRLSSGATRQDWLLVGKACQLLRVEAMRTAHTNRPEGRRYNQEYSDLLKANGFAGIDKAVRSKLFFILDNIAEIEKWLATLPANKRLELNHPHAIWRAYQRAVVKPDDGKEKKPSHVEQLRVSLIESQKENAKLKREAERGTPFTRQDIARDIAGCVFRMISPSKAREVARELNRLVRAAAAEDQTAIEVRA